MKTANKNEKKLVFLEDIKEQLTAVTDDTTCLLHIAAEVDQILELAAPVKAIVVPPVKLGDTVFYIMGDGKIMRLRSVSCSGNRTSTASPARSEARQLAALISVSVPASRTGAKPFLQLKRRLHIRSA